MAVLKEYYNTGHNASVATDSSFPAGQTFTAGSSYNLAYVKLKLFRDVGTFPGTVTVALYATSGGLPTGDVLASGTIDGDTLAEGEQYTASGEWTVVNFSSPYGITSGTKYAIVITTGGDAVYADMDVTSPTYSGGSLVIFSGSWGAYTSYDLMFECWEGGVPPEKAISPAPLDGASNIGINTPTLTWADGGGADSYDVYFGLESGNLDKIVSGITDVSADITSFTPMDYSTVYYWRIDSINANGTTTGDEWSFTVQDPVVLKDRLDYQLGTTSNSSGIIKGVLFTAQNTYVLTQVSVYSKKSVSFSRSAEIRLYSVGEDNKPDELLNIIGVLSDSNLTTEFAWIDFTGLSINIVEGTKYILVQWHELTPPEWDTCPYLAENYPREGFQAIGWVDDWVVYDWDDGEGLQFRFYRDLVFPEKPTVPVPAHEATGVDFSGKTISWSNGGSAENYDVYFGQNGNLISLGNTNNTSMVITYTTETDENGTIHAYINSTEIDWNVPFYWRIDAVNESGTTTGDTWWFDARPIKAVNVTPLNGGENIDRDIKKLVWADGGGTDNYDVYFGTETGNITELIPGIEDVFGAIPLLDGSEEYFWRIDSVNEFGMATGDEWSFQTLHTDSFPWERPHDYDPDLVWDWDVDHYGWVNADLSAVGGGRYKQQLIAIGHGVIYFGGV